MNYDEIVIKLEKIYSHDDAVELIDYHNIIGNITDQEWSKLYRSICDADLY